MKIKVSGATALTAAQREADKAFKPAVKRELSEADEVKKAFDANRERLKAERLARESKK